MAPEGGPQGRRPKLGGPKGGRPKMSRFSFLVPPKNPSSCSFLEGSCRGKLVGFSSFLKRMGPKDARLGFFCPSCANPSLAGPLGFDKNGQESSRVHVELLRDKNAHIQREDLPERGNIMKCWAREGQTAPNVGGPAKGGQRRGGPAVGQSRGSAVQRKGKKE